MIKETPTRRQQKDNTDITSLLDVTLAAGGGARLLIVLQLVEQIHQLVGLLLENPGLLGRHVGHLLDRLLQRLVLPHLVVPLKGLPEFILRPPKRLLRHAERALQALLLALVVLSIVPRLLVSPCS